MYGEQNLKTGEIRINSLWSEEHDPTLFTNKMHVTCHFFHLLQKKIIIYQASTDGAKNKRKVAKEKKRSEEKEKKSKKVVNKKKPEVSINNTNLLYNPETVNTDREQTTDKWIAELFCFCQEQPVK